VSKPAIFLVLGAAAIVLAIGLGVLAPVDKREKRTVAAPSETEESTAEPSPPVPKEAVRESPPRLPTPVPIAARRPKREEPPAPERLDEPSLIARLHDLAASDPPQSLKLAREALERFRDSPHAPEFEWNVVKALANMDRYDEAEEEAHVMLEKYPDNPLSIDVEHHLLNHPPNPPGTP
jgi:hypothetical protein